MVKKKYIKPLSFNILMINHKVLNIVVVIRILKQQITMNNTNKIISKHIGPGYLRSSQSCVYLEVVILVIVCVA